MGLRLSTLIVCTPPKTRPRHLRGGLDNVSDMSVLHAMEATFLSPSRPAGWCTRAQFHIHCARDATHHAQLNEVVTAVCGSSRGLPESKSTGELRAELFMRKAQDMCICGCTHKIPKMFSKVSLYSPHIGRAKKLGPLRNE